MMRRIRWRIAVPYVVLILLVMTGLVLYLSGLLQDAYESVLQDRLVAEASLVLDRLESSLQSGDTGDLDQQARRWSDLSGVRITVIQTDGLVLGESHKDRAQLDNHLYRLEVQHALDGDVGLSVRFSQTLGYRMMYVAVPRVTGDRVTHVVRLAYPLSEVEAGVTALRRLLVMVSVTAAFIGVLLSIGIAERITKPVRLLTRVAQRMTEGDLEARLLPTTRDEIGDLTHAFNEMATALRDKIDVLADERGRSSAVLENMADGVVITNADGRVRLINPAAVRLLDTDEARALGRTFAQVVRNHRVIELWQRCQEGGGEESELIEVGASRAAVRFIISPIRDSDQRSLLVILQDLTRLRHLETVRRDFVSNISHELRTPLASLKALVETLRDGAMNDPPAARRFLDRIDTEVDSLTQMVQELLELSRIESRQAPLRLDAITVDALIGPAVDRLRPQAERAVVRLSVTFEPGLPPVLADAEGIGQVVTNLVHNAIKFTPSGGEIDVSVSGQGDYVTVSVRDTGVGISAEDQPRIFERFYKADRARSGGGTGLGLAIAKHIVESHGGTIGVQSAEGRGSEFWFSLPTVTASA